MRAFLSAYFPVNLGWENDADVVLAIPPTFGFVDAGSGRVNKVPEVDGWP